MARNEDGTGRRGYWHIVVRPEDRCHKVGTRAALARCLRRLFAGTRKKTLATRPSIRVDSYFISTTEKKTMQSIKTARGHDAFVHIDGRAYVETRHLCETLTSWETKQGMRSVFGKSANGQSSYQLCSTGENEFFVSPDSIFQYSTNRPPVEAFLEKPKTSLGALTYEVEVEVEVRERARSTDEILDLIKAQISETDLAKSITAPSGEDIDALASEIYEGLPRKLKEFDDLGWREAYRLAHLRIELRNKKALEPKDIKSHNYVEGVSGWIVKAETGEFLAYNNGALRVQAKFGGDE